MAFFLSFALLSAIAISSPLHPVPVSNWFISGVLGISLIAPAISIACRQFVFKRLARQPEHSRRHLRLYVRCERVLPFLWFLASIVSVFVFRWRSIVRFNWGLDGAFLIDEILLMAPILLPWFVFWGVQYDFENRNHNLNGPGILTGRLSFAFSQARLLFGIVLAPLTIVSTYWDLNQSIAPGIKDSPMGWVSLLVPLIVLFFAYPILLRYIWPTEPLSDSNLRQQLDAMANQAGLSIRDVLVWETPGKLPNAAMTGIVPSLQYVFVTKSLIEQFTDREVQATFAHELGHIRFHHNLMRMLALLFPVVTLGLAAKGIAVCSSWLGFDLISQVATVPTAFTPLLGLALTLGYLVFVFGWFCRQLEHQADSYACRLLGESIGFETATSEYVELLDHLADGAAENKREWLHPSWDERKDFVRLRSAETGSGTGHCERRAFELRVRRIGLAIGCATSLGCVGCIYHALSF